MTPAGDHREGFAGSRSRAHLNRRAILAPVRARHRGHCRRRNNGHWWASTPHRITTRPFSIRAILTVNSSPPAMNSWCRPAGPPATSASRRARPGECWRPLQTTPGCSIQRRQTGDNQGGAPPGPQPSPANRRPGHHRCCAAPERQISPPAAGQPDHRRHRMGKFMAGRLRWSADHAPRKCRQGPAFGELRILRQRRQLAAS